LLEKGPFHFVGIGGISMSGIARLLLEQNFQVSGSDIMDSEMLQGLKQSGAKISIGHDPQNVIGAGVVVVSSAIPEDNCELKEAKRLGIPIWQRAQMIARLMEGKKGVAIAGTHGKTTTTSMISLVLEQSGLDPTVLIGGELNDLGGNAKLGNGDLIVTEADESDGSFLFFSPEIAVITNIELDHPDYFSSYKMVLDIFKRFISRVSPQGTLVVCADNPGVKDLLCEYEPQSRVLTFGLEEGFLRGHNSRVFSGGSSSEIFWGEEYLGELNLQVPGFHNIYNALAVMGVGLSLGLDFSLIKKGLENYSGVQRRFEIKGEEQGVKVVDDYAHHPTEIKATIEAARSGNPKKVVAVFQPHRYSRTKYLLQGFVDALKQADRIIITSIYAASEPPIPGISGERLGELLKKEKGEKAVSFYSDMEKIPELLSPELKSGDIVLTLGAGNIHQVGPVLLDLLKIKAKVSSGGA